MSQLESRVARLESDVSHIRSDVSLMQVDLRDFRKATDAGFERVYAKMEAMNGEFNAKLDKVDAKFDARFEKINEKFDKRFDEVNKRFNEVATKIGDLKVWALIVIGGGVLSVVAHALH